MTTLQVGNSQEIIDYKRIAMSKTVSVENIVQAINAKDENGNTLDAGDLFYTHIFPYAFIPDTIDEAGCYITYEISMPQASTVNYFFKEIILIVTIICHQDLMQMRSSEPLGATGATRTDYISVEIDKLFNLQPKILGPYELELVSNVEGAIDPVHRCRTMRFKTKSQVRSQC